MAMKPETIETALRHLRKADRVLGRVIDQVGPFKLTLERDRYRMLVRSILSQQISTSAARAIRTRLEELIAPDKISPDAIARLTPEQLRAVGLSGQKAGYVMDLTQKVLAGEVKLQRLGRMTDEEAIEELVKVRGIGVWTAQMMLIFSLGRLDVLPHDDFGVRAAIRNMYGLADLPKKAECHSIAECWRPYASIASWYCWRSHELPK